MKKIVSLIALVLMCSAAYAEQGKPENIFNATTVAGTGSTVTSRIFNMNSVSGMGYWLKLAPRTGNASFTGSNVALYMEVSPNDTVANFATVTTLSFATNNVATAGTLTVPNMKYVRFRATGLTGQATDSTITAYVFSRE